MSANLIGFALGWDGMLYMLKLASDSTTGLATLGTSCVAVFSAVQMMFEYRWAVLPHTASCFGLSNHSAQRARAKGECRSSVLDRSMGRAADA